MTALNILVVDDAAFIRDLVKKAVRETYPDCTLYEAIDGRKAISQLNAHNINLVLCDWEMPEVSGIEVLQWMRGDERYQSTPFMMITSRGERSHVIKAVEAGVSEYIGKPFTRDQFVTKLSKLVYKHFKLRPSQARAQSMNDSAAVLTTQAQTAGANRSVKNDMGGTAVLMANAPVAEATETADAKPAAKVSPKLKANASTKPKGIADIRFGSGGNAKLVIKDINLQEVLGVFRRSGDLPALLEPVVLDIADQETGDVARINGFVRMMQAQETSPDAGTIQMLIRYADDDPEKLETLSRFIAKVR